MRLSQALASVLWLGLVSGCAVGPDFDPPTLADGAGFKAEKTDPAEADAAPHQGEEKPEKTVSADTRNGAAQAFVTGQDIPAQWWTLFRSPQLDEALHQAITANPDIEAASAAVKVAHENARAQLGAYYPTLTGTANGARTRLPSGSLAPISVNPATIYNLYTIEVAASYVPDIWGLNRRTVEVLRAQEENQQFQYEQVYLGLTSSVVVTAITEAALREQIKATEDMIDLQKDALEIAHKRMELGDVAGIDVLAQESALAQAEQALPPLKKQLGQTRDQLSVLMGRFPNQPPEQVFTLDVLHLPEDVPVSLPSKLVEQRPDVGAAQANFHAATASVGIAIANRLPNITLSANMGSVAPYVFEHGGLLTPGMGFWSLGTDVTATLFDGFTLERRQRAAEAGVEQTAAQYRSTVLAAFQNVADILDALEHDATALKSAANGQKSASETLDIAHRQYELGAVPYFAVLSAVVAERQAHLALAQAEAQRLADTALLFQSLGGGWWNRDLKQDAAETE